MGSGYNISAETITLDTGSTLTMNGGSLLGEIDGAGAGRRTLQFSQDFATQNTIGGKNRLNTASISSGQTLTLNNNIFAKNLTIGDSSTLKTGTISRTLTTDMTIGSGTLDLSNSNLTIDGNLNIDNSKTATLKTTLGSNSIKTLTINTGTLTLGNSSTILDI